MTDAQNKKCHAIIHTAAIACGAGNLIPVPGTGLAADIISMTTMTVSLAAVFGKDIPAEVAKGMAIAALKKTILKQPIKTIGKELSKLIFGLGQIVAPAVSASFVEAAGWAIASDMARQYS